MTPEQPIESLTEREREILVYLAEHLSNQEIADRLFLSLKTIKWYNTQIFEKLGVKNRVEAIRHFKSVVRTSPAIHPKSTLPLQAIPFIGRESELHELTALLNDPGVRIITILGPGGMGKTRLAIEVAARSAQNLADQAYFVALAQIASSADLVTAIGDGVGMAFLGAGEAKQQLFDFLRGQELLLLLDNFEHLLSGAALVSEIVASIPGIKVLITSREKLHLSGETIYALGGMKVPESAADPLSFDSVHLFLYHAYRVRRDFIPDDPSSITRIAQLTQGMPLGLVLAAAWADVLSPMQIADEISRGIDVLQQEVHDLPVRHRSIRAVFDPTWERLTETQRELFMQLSVFRGGFTREAAQAVAGADLRMLSILAGKALIQLQPNRRYAIHELLRQYGESHLVTSDATFSTHAAHSAFFMDFLAQREEDVKGRRQIAALREINDDYENIRNAWLWSLAHKEFDAIDRALECLAIAGEISGRLPETRSLLQQSADGVVVQAPLLWERVIVRLSNLKTALRNEENVELVELILGRARERDQALEVVWCLWVLGNHEAIIKGNDQQSRLYHEELINLCHATGNDYFRAHGLRGVSPRYANSGEVKRAVESFRESIAIRKKIGDVKNLDDVTIQLSWITFDHLQATESAEGLLDEQIYVQNQMGTTPFLPLFFGVKAMMALWRNEMDAALELAQKGLVASHNQNFHGARGMCQGVLGMVNIVAGDYKEAQLACQEVRVSGSAPQTAFLAHWALSLSSYGLGDEAGGRGSLITALKIACRYKSPTFQGMCLLLVAIVEAGKCDLLRAAEYLAFCFSQPPHLAKWLHRWTLLDELRGQLQSKLSVDAYAAAWARGQELDLNQAAANELAELLQ